MILMFSILSPVNSVYDSEHKIMPLYLEWVIQVTDQSTGKRIKSSSRRPEFGF